MPFGILPGFHTTDVPTKDRNTTRTPPRYPFHTCEEGAHRHGVERVQVMRMRPSRLPCRGPGKPVHRCRVPTFPFQFLHRLFLWGTTRETEYSSAVTDVSPLVRPRICPHCRGFPDRRLAGDGCSATRSPGAPGGLAAVCPCRRICWRRASRPGSAAPHQPPYQCVTWVPGGYRQLAERWLSGWTTL